MVLWRVGHGTEYGGQGREYVLVGLLFLMQYVYKHSRRVANYTGYMPCKYGLISMYNKLEKAAYTYNVVWTVIRHLFKYIAISSLDNN